MKRLAPGQRRLLLGLNEAGDVGGVFDRWLRVVANGEVLTSAGATTVVSAFRYGWIKMDNGRVKITRAGAKRLLAG